jgi:hypothetical protein
MGVLQGQFQGTSVMNPRAQGPSGILRDSQGIPREILEVPRERMRIVKKAREDTDDEISRARQQRNQIGSISFGSEALLLRSAGYREPAEVWEILRERREVISLPELLKSAKPYCWSRGVIGACSLKSFRGYKRDKIVKGDVSSLLFHHTLTQRACREFIDWLKKNDMEVTTSQLSRWTKELQAGKAV